MFLLVDLGWGHGFEVKAEKCAFFLHLVSSAQQIATGDGFLFFSPHPSTFSSEPHQQQQQQQQQNAISDRYVSIAISSEISQLNG